MKVILFILGFLAMCLGASSGFWLSTDLNVSMPFAIIMGAMGGAAMSVALFYDI